jgi:hypothetical protein
MSAHYLSTAVVPVQRYITEDEYDDLVDRVRSVIAATTPSDSTVLVVSRGDDLLVDLEDRRGWHFPQESDGTYAGYYPADSEEAIGHLDDLVESGADYLVLPRTAFWWPDHYAELARHLAAHFRLVVRLDETCLIYALSESGERLAAFLDSLLPPKAAVAVVSNGDSHMLDLGRPASHFPADEDGNWASAFDTGHSEIPEALDELRADGTRFLVVPADAFGSPQRDPDFLALLRARFHEVANRPTLCSVFDLGRPITPAPRDPETRGPGDETVMREGGVAGRLKKALWRGRAAQGGESR